MSHYVKLLAAAVGVGATVGLVLVAADAVVGKLITDRWGWGR